MKRPVLPKFGFCAVAMAAMLAFVMQTPALAQEEGPATSRGENFSAKPAPQLFQSDCTGAGCHKGPQGLAKGQGVGSLAGFLREHYTNSRESAAALAAYLSKVPAGPEPREPREARTPRREPAATNPGFGSLFSGFGSTRPKREPRSASKPEPKPDREAKPEVRPEPGESRASRQHPSAQSSRAAAHADDEARASRRGAEAKERDKEKEKESPKPAARAQRGAPPATAASPPPLPEPAPPAPPPKKEYDIFD